MASFLPKPPVFGDAVVTELGGVVGPYHIVYVDGAEFAPGLGEGLDLGLGDPFPVGFPGYLGDEGLQRLGIDGGAGSLGAVEYGDCSYVTHKSP